RGNGYGQPYQRADLTALKEPTAQEPEHAEPSWLSQLGDTFGDELKKLKGLAIGTSLGLLRDMIARSVPDNLGPQLTKLVDDVTTKIGGEPVRGPVLREDS
ncbi:MAG: hypothetical protein L0099_00180, partial [Acidobacteria bacterium]|nr:hypothetical protein [Acidobacteriota bacterium]